MANQNLIIDTLACLSIVFLASLTIAGLAASLAILDAFFYLKTRVKNNGSR